MLYAMEEEDRDDPAAHDINSEEYWNKLSSIFKQTHEMIKTMAAEQGIDLDSLDLEEAGEEENRRRARSNSNPLARSAQRYVKLVNEWFDNEYSEAEQSQDADATRGDLPLVDFEAQDRAAGIQDAIAVVRWYQFQIAVKIMRGLMSHDPDEEDQIEDGYQDEQESSPQSDSDGSAKVALIGMERSISAWARLREFLPGKADSISPLMLHLEQLRRATEHAFPKAQSFVRPGFDEAPDQYVS